MSELNKTYTDMNSIFPLLFIFKVCMPRDDINLYKQCSYKPKNGQGGWDQNTGEHHEKETLILKLNKLKFVNTVYQTF